MKPDYMYLWEKVERLEMSMNSVMNAISDLSPEKVRELSDEAISNLKKVFPQPVSDMQKMNTTLKDQTLEDVLIAALTGSCTSLKIDVSEKGTMFNVKYNCCDKVGGSVKCGGKHTSFMSKSKDPNAIICGIRAAIKILTEEYDNK